MKCKNCNSTGEEYIKYFSDFDACGQPITRTCRTCNGDGFVGRPSSQEMCVHKETKRCVIYSVAWYSNKHAYYRNRQEAFFSEANALAFLNNEVVKQKKLGYFGTSIALFKEFYDSACPSNDPNSQDTFEKKDYILLYSNPVASEKSKTVKGGKIKGGLIG